MTVRKPLLVRFRSLFTDDGTDRDVRKGTKLAIVDVLGVRPSQCLEYILPKPLSSFPSSTERRLSCLLLLLLFNFFF